ncbi:MAG: hypothetical protein OEQ18_10995 [Gammaproteobacteria bacterium]|nr:hypothetical protein [Gammaproteobacteria bacterium]
MSRSRAPVRAAADGPRGAWAALVAGLLMTACASNAPMPSIPPVEPPPVTSPGPSSSGASETAPDRSPAQPSPAGPDGGTAAGVPETDPADPAGAAGERAAPEREPTGVRESDSAAEPAGTAGSPPSEALTDSERISRLNDRLKRGLSEFDGLILREQQGVRVRTQEQGVDLPESGDPRLDSEAGSSGGAEAPADGESAPGGNASSGAGNQPDTPSSPGDGQPEQPQTAANIPPDISDGSDDDVVARQIREAAMRETDPALREKLWDEYRKYKNRNR